MANLDEIRKSIQVLINNGLNKDRISVLHCNTEYPTPMIDVNLKAMLTIKETRCFDRLFRPYPGS